MKLRILVFLFVALSGGASFAATDSHRAAAQELIQATGGSEMMGKVQHEITLRFDGLISDIGVPAERRAVADGYRKRLVELLSEELSWEKIEADVIALYVNAFTEKELLELVEFYESPLGQKTVTKMPQIMQASVEMSQAQIKRVLPKIQQLSREMGREISQAQQSEAMH